MPESENDETKKEAQAEMQEYGIKYEKYCKKYGVEKSCHIPREHGEDISLMSEIVYKNVELSAPLFP